jgi:hypothetical protein
MYQTIVTIDSFRATIGRKETEGYQFVSLKKSTYGEWLLTMKLAKS